MKIACTADWHIHQFSDFSKQLMVQWDETKQRFVTVRCITADANTKPMNSRLYFILQSIADLRDYCVAENIGVVFHAGDVFHKRATLNVETYNATHRLIQSFHQYGINLYMIAGNHDQVDASDNPDTSIHTLPYVNTIENPIVIPFDGGFKVAFVPYGKKQAVMKFIKENQSKDTILVAHLGMTGATVGSGAYVMNDEYNLNEIDPNKWKYVVLGHYHHPQMLHENAFYCGSITQNTFNDERLASEDSVYNGFFVIDTSRRWDVGFVPVVTPRFITVNADKTTAKSITKVLSAFPQHYYRIQGATEQVEQATEMLEKVGGSQNVRMETVKDYTQDIRSDIGISDTFADAVTKYASENNLNPDVGLEILKKVMENE